MTKNIPLSLHTKNSDKLQDWIQERSFLILSYTINFNEKTSHYLSGPSQDLLVYLKKRAKRVVFFEQPDPVSEDLQPKAVCYENGVWIEEFKFPMFWFPMSTGRREIASTPLMYVLFKVRDFLSTLYFSFKVKKKFDVCVAVESPNAITAFILRLFGKCSKVVYDMIDYSPNRFENSTLNGLFHWLDKMGVYLADTVWNQTKKISEERFAQGYKPEKCAPQLVKPTGILTNKIHQLSINEIDRHKIVYMGSFLKRDGVEVLLNAFRDVARKVPNAKLLMIGEGELKEELIHFVAQEGLSEQCEFLGMIEDEAKLEDLLLYSAVGVAPYSDEAGSVKAFNDVSKPKVYLSCGLPVVITAVPAVSEEIQKYGAGVRVAYDKEEMAGALTRLLTDDRYFEKARFQAHQMAQDYSWDHIFDRLFEPFCEQEV